MKNVKTALALILALCVAVCLCACNRSGGDTAAGSKAVKILEKNKDNDVVQKLLELLPKQ